MKGGTYFFYVVLFFTLGIRIGIVVERDFTDKDQPKIKPCNHLSPQQVILYHEKSERFVDELQRAKGIKRKALIDSANLYRSLSGVNVNKIEY